MDLATSLSQITGATDITQITQIFTVIGIAYYLIQCFFGYKLLKISCAIFGFLLGFLAGYAIAVNMMPDGGYIPAVIGVVAGIVIALIAFKLYLVGVFIYCGLFGVSMSLLLPIPSENPWNIVKIVVMITAFVVFGILSVKFSKLFIIGVSSIGGSVDTIMRLSAVITVLSTNNIMYYGAIVVLAVLGFVVQFITNRNS